MKEYSSGPLFGILKPKYRVLSTILGENFFPDNGLDVFLDLNSVINALSTSTKYLGSLPFSEHAEQDLVEGMLTTLKHWKDFTRKWNDVRIFLILNDFEFGNLPERDVLKAYLVPYSHKFEQDRYKQLTYYWNEACTLVENVIDFIPKSYMLRCNKFDSMVVPNIIDDYEKNGRTRFIISGSSIMTGYNFAPNTQVAYSCYRYNGMTQYSDPLMIVQTLTKIDSDLMNAFTQNKVFYNLLNTIIGDKDRGIIGITQLGITTFANELLRSIEKREVPANPKSIETVLPVINEQHHEYLKKNYQLIDVDLHAQMIPPSIVEKTRARLVDKSDIDTLMKFNIGGLNLMELI